MILTYAQPRFDADLQTGSRRIDVPMCMPSAWTGNTRLEQQQQVTQDWTFGPVFRTHFQSNTVPI